SGRASCARRLCAGGARRRAGAQQGSGLGLDRAWGVHAMKRVLPAPLLSLALWVLWMVLNRSLDAGHALVGLLLCIAIPLFTRGLRPLPVRVRHPLVILRLGLRVAADTVQSNIDTLRVFIAPS